MESAQAPIFSVNGTEIAPEAIAAEAQNHPSDNPDEAWSEAARALAIKTLLLEEADRLSIEAPLIDDAQGRTLAPDDARIEALLEQEVTTPDADEETCRRYYDQHIDQFSSPDLVEASHILFAAPKDDQKRYAKAELSAIDTITELKDHPERFAALAETLSACPSAKQAGNLGQIGPGQTVEEFETFLFNLEPNQICPVPVKTRFGVHVVKAGRKISGETLPFEAMQTKIADYLEESSWRRAVAQYMKILVGKADILGFDIEGSEGLLVQ
ncbi:peptidylprolyl isomerase [Sphingorhabdus sp. Alg231-15]|uniref:peptidylprolyl isomerase n=1 Tax=Sphingorhabdus sp. Alg231-15 TaxID=1922222 RepID=UPI000D556A6F